MDTENSVKEVLEYISGFKCIALDTKEAYSTQDKSRIKLLQNYQAIVRVFHDTPQRIKGYRARDAEGNWISCHNRAKASHQNKKWKNRDKS